MMMQNLDFKVGFNPTTYLNRVTLILFMLLFCNTFSVNSQTNKKVVMISLDGVPDFLVDKFLKNGVLPANGAFALMKKNGAFAETVFPINVASTGPSHISIFTGASPSKTGIVGNSFRSKSQKWSSPNLSAFKQPIAAETIFQAAMKQGKKVITLAGVGIDYDDKSRMTDYMHMYPKISGPSLVLDLEVTDSTFNKKDIESFIKLKVTPNSVSKPFFEVSGNFKIPLHFYLKDSNFDTMKLSNRSTEIFVGKDTDASNNFDLAIVGKSWTDMAIEKDGKKYNTSFRILHSDEKLGKFKILMTTPAEVYGYPNGFLEKLQSQCGLWPGEPENRKQTSGLISEEIWFEQLDRLSNYSKNLILASIKENNWDLLFGYFSTLDDVQHRYTLTNSRQIDYTAVNGNRPKIYGEYIEKQFQKIDAYLLEIIKALPSNANLVVFSDHGMIPIHTTLMLNNYFKQSGFNDTNENITSVTSGNSAHIYINKEKIKTEDYNNYLNKLVNALKSLKDNKTGEHIFELIANKEQQKKYGLYSSEYSGDLFVSCKSGYSISDRIQSGVNYLLQNSFDPKMFEKENQATRNFLLSGTMNETGRAVHGCLASLREGQSVFYAIGPDVPKNDLKNMNALQIAPTIAKLLKIKPPTNAELEPSF